MFSILFSALGKKFESLTILPLNILKFILILFSFVSVLLALALQLAAFVRIFETFVYLNFTTKTKVVNSCSFHHRISPTITTVAKS